MKARKILLWTVGVPLALYATAWVALFRTTKPIEGVLVDARTGKPVSKALVHANWFFRYPGIVDTRSGGFGHGTVTGEDGRFRIPRRNVTSVFREFVDQGLIVKHPLYEFLEQPVYAPWDKGKEYRVGKVEGGVLKLTLPIMSLEDKYSKPEDMPALSRVIGSCGPDFYESMKKSYGIRYDVDEIMKNLERIAARFLGPDYRTNDAYRAYMYHEIVMNKYRQSN